MTRIIGFCGRKYSGKDSAAKAILDRYPAAERFAFASEIKRIAQRVYGFTRRQTDGDLKEVVDTRWGITPREVMQRIGTEMGRSIHEDTWVRYALDNEIPSSGADIAVLTDVRFDNEAKAIRARGGTVIRIVRPGLPRGPFSGHPSETGIDLLEVDHEIVNDGSIADLHRKVLDVVNGV